MQKDAVEKAKHELSYATKVVVEKLWAIQHLEEDLRIAKLKLAMAENHVARAREALQALEGEK